MELIVSIVIVIAVLMLSLASAVFTWLAIKFNTLEKTVIISLKDTVCLLNLLEKIENMEEAGPYLAKLAKLSEEEAKLEIEKGRMLNLVARKATEIKATLRASIPKGYKHLLGGCA